MQTVIETLVSQKAKALKVSKTKLMQLAEEIADVTQKQQANKTAVAGTVHNVTSDKIREAILNQKNEFTSKDIATRVGATVVAVNNNLFSLQRRGIVMPTGETRKHGGRGKPATVWKLAKH